MHCRSVCIGPLSLLLPLACQDSLTTGFGEVEVRCRSSAAFLMAVVKNGGVEHSIASGTHGVPLGLLVAMYIALFIIAWKGLQSSGLVTHIGADHAGLAMIDSLIICILLPRSISGSLRVREMRLRFDLIVLRIIFLCVRCLRLNDM